MPSRFVRFPLVKCVSSSPSPDKTGMRKALAVAIEDSLQPRQVWTVNTLAVAVHARFPAHLPQTRNGALGSRVIVKNMFRLLRSR
jgi:hypothetical protein